MQQGTLFEVGLWMVTKDGDAQAFGIFKRHYSFYQYADHRRSNGRYRNRFLFVGPGEKLVLVTPKYDALFAWRKFKDDSGQKGVNCAVFRNESKEKSSALILAAELFAMARWPGERLYTYVNGKKVKSANPGYCFKMAGWNQCGETKNGLLIFEKEPDHGRREQARNDEAESA